VYTHIRLHKDCILPPNNTANVTFFTNQEWCEVFTGYLSLGNQVVVTVPIHDNGQNILHSSFQTGSGRSPSYFQIFCLITFLKETIIRNII